MTMNKKQTFSDAFMNAINDVLHDRLGVIPPSMDYLRNLMENDECMQHEYEVFYKDYDSIAILDTATREYIYEVLAEKFGDGGDWPCFGDSQARTDEFYKVLFANMKAANWTSVYQGENNA